MITCWVIYTYKNKLSSNMAKKFQYDTYEDIKNAINSWSKNQDDITILDVAETIYNEDEE
jgi:hypothetical protein